MSYKYLILGLLAQNPMTGYDMRKHINDMQSRLASLHAKRDDTTNLHQ